MMKRLLPLLVLGLTACSAIEVEERLDGTYRPYHPSRLYIKVLSSEGNPIEGAKISIVSLKGDPVIGLVSESKNSEVLTNNSGIATLTNTGGMYEAGGSRKCIMVSKKQYCEDWNESKVLGNERILISAKEHYENLESYEAYVNCRVAGSECTASLINELDTSTDVKVTVVLQHY